MQRNQGQRRGGSRGNNGRNDYAERQQGYSRGNPSREADREYGPNYAGPQYGERQYGERQYDVSGFDSPRNYDARYDDRQDRPYTAGEYGNPDRFHAERYPSGGYPGGFEDDYGQGSFAGRDRPYFQERQRGHYGYEGTRSQGARFEQYDRGPTVGARGGYGNSTFGGQYGESEHETRSQHFDPDYSQWRDEQVRGFDEDYGNWRKERFGKFSEEFNEWRKNRQATRASETSGNKDKDRK